MAKGSVNKVILIGNIGKDPETRKTTTDLTVVNMSIATTDVWKDKSGQKTEKTEWHRIVLYGKLAEIAAQYLKKGAKVCIEGKLQTRKWQDKDGKDHYTTEIIADKLEMLGKSPNQETAADYAMKDSNNSGEDEFNDDIPF